MSTQLSLHSHESAKRFVEPSSLASEAAPILLLSMPFGLPYMPSLGLSLLKSGLARRGIAADVRYLGMSFAQTISYPLYQRLAHGGSGNLGDWIFYRALYGPPSKAQTERFWKLSFPERSPREMAPNFEVLQARIAQAQEQACTFIEETLHEIDWAQYRMVGFTTMFQQNLASLSLAKRIKELHPKLQILFGGPNVEGDMGAGLMACFPFIDFVFSGESDDRFPAFTAALLAGERHLPLTGVISRDNPGGPVRRPTSWGDPITEMDALPYPNFDDFYAQFNIAFPEFQPHLNYETARGCWWGAKSHCTFCGLNGLTMAFRSKSPDRAIDEIDFLHQRYMEPNQVVLMQPADQILDLRYFDSMIPRLPTAAPGIPTFFETKSNLNRAQVKALAEAHVQLIQPGIESLSSPVLKLMRKGCTLLQNVQLLKWCAEFGLHPIWNLLYGFPGESEADYQQTSEVVPMVAHLQPPKKFFAIELDRFSPYFTSPTELGIENIRPPEIISLLYPFDTQHQYDVCYTFDFDYIEPREPTTYLGAALERVARLWTRTRRRGALVGFYNAERLLIWDSRIGAVAPWVEIHGPYREALLLTDRIRAEGRLRELFTDALGESKAESVSADFLTQMAQRGFILREDGRVLSLVVLHAVSENLPAVSNDQIVHITPEPNVRATPTELIFGSTAIDEALAGPPDDNDRYQVVLNGSLTYTSTDDCRSTDVKIDGVCVVESFWGVSACRLSGLLQKSQGTQTRLELTAERVSGFESGPWTLVFKSDDDTAIDIPDTCISGAAHYHDEVNSELLLRMEIDRTTQQGDLHEVHFMASGDGFRFASFLASGESVGGAEAV